MKDESIVVLDGASRLAVTVVSCTAAAAEAARSHLSGPTAACYLAQSLAGAALLGAECSAPEETVSFRLTCPGPLEGFLAEATQAGTLRGYTKRKILNDFDGLRVPKDVEALGASGTVEIIRSVPGRILASGTVALPFSDRQAVAAGLEAFFTQSLQRRVRVALTAAAGDDGVPVFARGVLVECPPDGEADAFARVAACFETGAAAKALSGRTLSVRTLLGKLGLPQAEGRERRPVSFACRCSASRAQAMLAALPPEEREGLPPAVDITCHMCGRTWTVSV
jgi:molecular chaperone Hsp33